MHQALCRVLNSSIVNTRIIVTWLVSWHVTRAPWWPGHRAMVWVTISPLSLLSLTSLLHLTSASLVAGIFKQTRPAGLLDPELTGLYRTWQELTIVNTIWSVLQLEWTIKTLCYYWWQLTCFSRVYRDPAGYNHGYKKTENIQQT